jgi:hypothetical protein
MGSRGLTAKQRRFAELLASGSTKVDAFRRAYPSDRRGKATAWEGSKRVARHPAVAAEVQRLALLRSPHDMVAQAEHIAARLLELSKSSEPSVALRAIAQWGKLAEAGLLKPPTTAAEQCDVAIRPMETAGIIDQLRGLYAKALGENWRRNELAAPTTTEEADGQIMSDGELLGELPGISMEEEPLQSLPEFLTNQDAGDGPVSPEVPEEAVLQTDEYEWQYQPGSFGKPRRVRVRVR